MKQRLDKIMAQRGIVSTRSQAESWIRLGKVRVNGVVANKPGVMVAEDARIELLSDERYVSRAGLKLASVAEGFGLDFRGKLVLDVGSSTGGFTDYALQHGARRVVAVDVGTEQLHPNLRADERVELHEKTDIRHFRMSEQPDIVLIDVSFISLREILPTVAKLSGTDTQIIAMVKPQFEAGKGQLGSSGVVKNQRLRREIIKSFEQWARGYFVIQTKADSQIAGAHGNLERFYILQLLS